MAIRTTDDEYLRPLPAHCTRLPMKSFILHPAFAPKVESAGGWTDARELRELSRICKRGALLRGVIEQTAEHMPSWPTVASINMPISLCQACMR